MNVLVIGSGGREHALAWKILQSAHVDHVFVAPGNGGTAIETDMTNIDIAVDDIPKLIDFAKNNNIGLTIVGPEAPLVIGVVDAFEQAGLRCFGPKRLAAQLEGSKAFTKDFLARHHIPTAAYQSFTDIDKAIQYIQSLGAPLVIKADGLAAGKGVIIAHTEQEAIQAAQDMLTAGSFGSAGAKIVVEQFLQGEEASFIVMVDGKNILPLATSQDHKARDDGDKGPNTGGMGAYSPAPVVTAQIHTRIMNEVIIPTVNGLAAEGTPYTGFLYAGIMVAPDGVPNVLEFNCRFGDPETQPIMMRLRSDLVELCDAALNGELDTVTAQWDPRAALGIVLAAGGYPDAYRKGDVISGLAESSATDAKIFHAGTVLKDGQIVTQGGRVLCATALGATVSEAQQRAYQLASTINWQDMFYRTDIGYRAVAREKTSGGDI
jgi:phosphoribosylamine--glycine ligase